MNKFGAKLMSDVVQLILTRKVSSLDVFDDGEHFLELKLEPASSGSPQPINVLKNLDQLFRFVGEMFDIPVKNHFMLLHMLFMLTTQEKHNLCCQRVARLEGQTSAGYDRERAIKVSMSPVSQYFILKQQWVLVSETYSE